MVDFSMCDAVDIFNNFCLWFYKNSTIANIKDCITIITLSVGSYVAYQGLKAWKVQLKGNQEYNLAKSTLLNVYKYYESILQLRNPFSWDFEYPQFSRDELEQMSAREKEFRETKHQYQKRWEVVTKIKPVFYENVLETQVLWGGAFKDIIQKLFICSGSNLI
jgi:hypothetical protein